MAVYQKQVRTKGKFKEKTRPKNLGRNNDCVEEVAPRAQVAAHSPGRRLDDKGDIIELWTILYRCVKNERPMMACNGMSRY